MLKYIQSVLKVDRINYYPASYTIQYIIFKIDLQEILFPLILYYNLFFLINVYQKQFNRAIYIMKNNIIKFSDILDIIPTFNILLNLIKDYINLPFFVIEL